MGLNRILLLFILLVCSPKTFFSQGQYITKGTEFWAGFMKNAINTTESLRLYISSEYNTTGTISINQGGYTQNFTVAANQTTEIFIPQSIAINDINQSILDRGIQITTQDEVSVSCANYVDNTVDETQITSMDGLGTAYRILAYRGYAEPFVGAHSSEFLIVASEDNTIIQITPSMNTMGGNPANVPFNITLQKGQSYLVQGSSSVIDFTGTTIVGLNGDCRPFAVFEGAQMTWVPNSCATGDHLFTQCKPITQWSKEYLVAPLKDFSSFLIRVLANVDNTIVTVNGTDVATINAGEYFEQSYSTALCVNSNNAIAVNQYMKGSYCNGDLGDPSMTTVNGKSQLIDSVVFNVKDLPDFSIYKLNIISENSFLGQIELDGLPIDNSQFVPFSDCSYYAYAQIDVTPGTHVLNSTNGVQAYVYGYGPGNYESYLYSLGANSGILESSDNVLCVTDSVSIGNTLPLSSVWWSTGAMPADTLVSGVQSITVFPDSSLLYILHGISQTTSCPLEFSYLVSSVPNVSLTASPAQDTICALGPIQLNVNTNAPGTYSVTWSPSFGLSDETSLSPIANVANSIEYVVSLVNGEGCLLGEDSIQLIVKNGTRLDFSILASDTIVCMGDSSSLHVRMENVYHTENFDSLSFSPLIANSSGVNIEPDCAFSNTLTGSFSGLGNRFLETIPLNLTNGGNISFDIISSGYYGTCDPPEMTDDLILEYTLDYGLTWNQLAFFTTVSTASWTHVVIPYSQALFPVITKLRWRQTNNDGQDLDIWRLDNILITSYQNSGFDVSWSPPVNILIQNQGVDALIYPDTSTIYTATCYDSLTSCSIEHIIPIVIVPSFNLYVPDTISSCSYSGTQINTINTSPGPVSYDWSPSQFVLDSTAQNPIMEPPSSTTFQVIATSLEGCKRYDSVALVLNGLNYFELASSQTTTCIGDSTQTSLLYEIGGCTPGYDICSGAEEYTVFGAYSGGGTDPQANPFYVNTSSRLQHIYTASELNAFGITGPQIIKSIAIDVIYMPNSLQYDNLTVKMGCTGQNTMSTQFFDSLQTVLDPTTIVTTTGWNTLTFDYGFRWDGSSNIVIEYCYENPFEYTSIVGIGNYSSPSCGVYLNGDGVCTDSTGSSAGRKPWLKMGHCPIILNDLSYTWMPNYNISDPTVAEPSLYPYTTTMYYLNATDTVSGCQYTDSILVNIEGAYVSSVQYICQGDSVLIFGNYQSVSGNYYDTLQSYTGCDSITEIQLFAVNEIPNTITMTICDGDSVLIAGTYQSVSGSYFDTLQSYGGCDSIVETQLSIWAAIPITTKPITEVCAGDSVLIFGNFESSGGNYYDTLQSYTGCDSIIQQPLVVLPVPVITIASPPETLCVYNSPVDLTFASPPGGTYSGNGVSNGSFDPGVAGIGYNTIYYSYTDSSLCTSIDSVTVLVDGCAGITGASVESELVRVYPNPFGDFVTIEFQTSLKEPYHIQVFDLIGRCVYNNEYCEDQQVIIDKKDLVTGVYHLVVTSQNQPNTVVFDGELIAL